MSRALTTALLVLVLGAFVTAAQAEADVPKALDYLVASQNEDGSWGGGLPDLRWRDTGVALEALRRRGDLRANRAQALEFLRGAGGGGSDLLARRARARALFGESATVLLQSLWSIRREATTDPASPNYPDGGWGLTSFYQTDVLDTSLVLQAFEAAGFANGLTAANEVLAVGEERLYTVRTPAAAGSVSAYFPSLSISGGSGSLNLWFVGPGGRLPESGWYVIGSPNTLVPWDGGSTPPFAPGLIEVHVRNDAGSTGAATFDLELSFTAGGIDSRDLREPVDYLRLAQDAGGGWGPTRGAPVQLFLSTHALLALEAFDRAFGTTAEVASGIAYLKASANPDGGFGSEAGTSTSFETALAAIVLLQNDPGDLDGAGALSWLEPRQLPDGSWEQDPYRTGLALRAFDAADPDADGDLVVDPVDNCHTLQNGDQTDTDADGTGDVCDEDDDNDGVLDGASAGDPSNTPFLAADITGMTGTLPAQPPGAFINFQVFDPTQVNLGWWDATNQAWIEADVSPEQRRLAFFVDTNSCFCIDMNDGDTLTPGTDSGDLTIYLPDQPAGWQGWLYVADDGSTYFDGALTSLAKAAPTEPGDNCRVVFNPGQEDRDTDGTGDACDPNDGEVNRLRILADGETLSWTPEEEAIEYNLYRGFVSALSSSNYGSCLLPGVTRDANLDGDPDSTDLDLPPAGDAYTYLATAEMAGGEGSLGRDSSGMERANSGPCP